MEDHLRVGGVYEEDFDADWYLKNSCSSVSKNTHITFPHKTKFIVDALHDVFESGKISGNKLLDLGSGPSVYSVISASRRVAEIHVSDLVKRNRELIHDWLKGEVQITEVFQYILDKENNWTALKEREDLVRQKVKKIYPVDLRQDTPLPMSNHQYDVIIASLVLTAAARTKDEYKTLATKIWSLLTKGGHFVEIGTLDSGSYRVGDVKFPEVSLSRDDVRETFGAVGYKVVKWREMKEDCGYEAAPGGRGLYAAVYEKL